MTLNHDGTVELSLAKVTSRDAGVYSCTAINEVGRAETSTRVNVIIGIDEADDKQIESLIEGLPTVTIASPDVPCVKNIFNFNIFVSLCFSAKDLSANFTHCLSAIVSQIFKGTAICYETFINRGSRRRYGHYTLRGRW